MQKSICSLPADPSTSQVSAPPDAEVAVKQGCPHFPPPFLRHGAGLLVREGWCMPCGCIVIYWFNMHTLHALSNFPISYIPSPNLGSHYVVIYNLKGVCWKEWAGLLFIRKNLQSLASLKIWPWNCINVSSVLSHCVGQLAHLLSADWLCCLGMDLFKYRVLSPQLEFK